MLSNAKIPLGLIRPTSRRRSRPGGEGLDLIQADVGRNLIDIRLNVDLAVEDLVQLIAGVTESLTPLEREVRDTAGWRRLLRVRPYKTMDGRLDGVVLALIDIEGIRQAADRSQELAREQERLQQVEASRNRFEGMLETISDAFCALDREGRLLHINGMAEQLLERSRDSLLGKSLWEEFPFFASQTALLGPFQRAIEANETVSGEVKGLGGRVYEARVYPTREGISLYLATSGTDAPGTGCALGPSTMNAAWDASPTSSPRLREPLRTSGAFTKLSDAPCAQFAGEAVEFWSLERVRFAWSALLPCSIFRVA